MSKPELAAMPPEARREFWRNWLLGPVKASDAGC